MQYIIKYVCSLKKNIEGTVNKVLTLFRRGGIGLTDSKRFATCKLKLPSLVTLPNPHSSNLTYHGNHILTG